MIKWCAGLAVFLVLATAAHASFAPKTSPIPRLRSSMNAAVLSQNGQEITTLVQIAEHERQKETFRKAATKQTSANKLSIGIAPIRKSPIPRLRPSSLQGKRNTQRVVASTVTPRNQLRTETRRKTRKGSVCGVRSIRGTNVARIRGRGGCGIANPVKITEVAGVALTREVTVNCSTAKRLDSWVARSAKPTIGRKGGGLSAIQIIGGYSCRTRNSKRGAKLSQHAVGNAVDIAGFKLRDGTIYNVKRDWRRGRGKATLRRLHKTACGPFGTVLGPNADRHHHDHFHFDIARHRSGSYCR